MSKILQRMPRKPCANCARKHLGQAIVLLQESLQGYPSHRWLAVGHIAEAEAEIGAVCPDIMEVLRKARKQMELDDEYVPDLMPVIIEISSRVIKPKTSACNDGCSIESPRNVRQGRTVARMTTRRGRP